MLANEIVFTNLILPNAQVLPTSLPARAAIRGVGRTLAAKPPRFLLAIKGPICSPATFATVRTSFVVAMAVLWPVLGRIGAHLNRSQAAIFKIFNSVGGVPTNNATVIRANP